VVKEEKVSAKVERKDTGKYFGIISRVLLSLRLGVWLVEEV
jgi:hypothetical protein